MKKYVFTNDSYYDSNGCSCCDDTYIEAYNCEDVDYTLGTAYSKENCYQHAIITSFGGYYKLPDDLLEEIWSMNLTQLKSLCNDLYIIVKIGD